LKTFEIHSLTAATAVMHCFDGFDAWGNEVWLGRDEELERCQGSEKRGEEWEHKL
jgi:hypothetical protein